MQGLQPALRKGGWKVTVGGPCRRGQIIRRLAGLPRQGLRARRRCRLDHHRRASLRPRRGEVVASAGLMNPQIRFGEDLMSRVSYVMMNPGGDGEMTEAVREAVNTLAAEVARRGRHRRADILEVTFVGNPVMHHSSARHRPARARRRALRARHRRRHTLWARETRPALHPGRASSCCPASPAMSAPTPPGVILSEAPHQSTR
jgi:hypothetical protein